MKRSPIIAALLSLLVPGLGQIYARESKRGALILIAVIIVGNLNAIWLNVFALTGSVTSSFWTHTLPWILHDIFAFYSVVFWIWQVADAFCQARKT